MERAWQMQLINPLLRLSSQFYVRKRHVNAHSMAAIAFYQKEVI